MLRLLVALAVGLFGCTQPDPEKEIEARLSAAAEAAEQRDTGFFRNLVSAAYADAHGNRRREVINRVRGVFLRYPRIHVASRIETIALQGDRSAEVVVLAGLSGDGGSVLAGLSADLYRFELEMVREDDGEWRLIAADWSSVRGGRP